MLDFETKLAEFRGALERFVRYKMPSDFDADDVIQEVFIAASRSFGELRDETQFRAWLIGIARNKCRDYYRDRARSPEILITSYKKGSKGIPRRTFRDAFSVDLRVYFAITLDKTP